MLIGWQLRRDAARQRRLADAARPAILPTCLVGLGHAAAFCSCWISPAASTPSTVHLPSYLIDRGLSAQIGGWTLATIGLFNIIGSLGSGYLGNRMPKRYILSTIYFARALSIVVFISLPASPVTTLIFGAVTGLLWLSTVPPTSALVALMFGTRWLAMLFGFAFFSHQVGGFLGVLLGGYCRDTFGSYNPVWWLSVFFGVMSAIINLPIVEKPVARPAMAPA